MWVGVPQISWNTQICIKSAYISVNAYGVCVLAYTGQNYPCPCPCPCHPTQQAAVEYWGERRSVGDDVISSSRQVCRCIIIDPRDPSSPEAGDPPSSSPGGHRPLRQKYNARKCGVKRIFSRSAIGSAAKSIFKIQKSSNFETNSA